MCSNVKQLLPLWMGRRGGKEGEKTVVGPSKRTTKLVFTNEDSNPLFLSLSRYFFNNGLKHHLSTTRLFFGYQNLVAHNGIPIKLVLSFTCKGRKQMQGVKRTVRENSGKGEKNREREEGGKRQDTRFRWVISLSSSLWLSHGIQRFLASQSHPFLPLAYDYMERTSTRSPCPHLIGPTPLWFGLHHITLCSLFQSAREEEREMEKMLDCTEREKREWTRARREKKRGANIGSQRREERTESGRERESRRKSWSWWDMMSAPFSLSHSFPPLFFSRFFLSIHFPRG